MLGRDPDAAQEWLRSWTAQVSEQARATAELSDRVAAVTATAESPDRLVRVTVNATGALTGLELDDRVQRLSGADLARIIMATVARAHARITDQVTAAVRDTVGVDTETGRAIIDSYDRRFPPPPDDGDDADTDRRGGRYGR